MRSDMKARRLPVLLGLQSPSPIVQADSTAAGSHVQIWLTGARLKGPRLGPRAPPSCAQAAACGLGHAEPFCANTHR